MALRTDGPGRKRNEHPDRGMTHGKRDTLECDIIIGDLLSFSPIVIFVVGIYKSASPKEARHNQ